MKTRAFILMLSCLPFLLDACQNPKSKYNDYTEDNESVYEWISSAANEANTIWGVNKYSPEEYDPLYDDTFGKMDSLKHAYVSARVTSLEETEVHSDIVGYLAHVNKKMFIVEDWLDEEDYRTYQNSLEQLHEYADKRFDYSPDEQIKKFPYHTIQKTLNRMMNYISWNDSEGDGDDGMIILYYRYLQQVFGYCPDVSKLTSMMTPDGRAALLHVDSCSYTPYSIPMLLKDRFDNWTPVIKGWFKPNRIYSFPFDEEKTFYLFSLHGKEMRTYDRFDCSLFVYRYDKWYKIDIPNYIEIIADWYTKEKVKTDEGDVVTEYYDAHITFNPKEKRWNFCTEKDGVYYPIPGSKTLYLRIDEKNETARFHLADEY